MVPVEVTDFELRPMAPADGPAIDRLMRGEAQTTRLSLSTEYLHDVVAALYAQHPTLFGVVVDAPGGDGLVGMATAFTDELMVGDTLLPAAQLENLKVRHDMRRHGLGSRLAAWRIEEARRRFGRDGVIVAGVEASNRASLATVAKWATHVLGPVRVVIAGPRSKPTATADGDVRPLDDRDVEAVCEGANAFFGSYVLHPPLTSARLKQALATTSFGWPIRAYRVAVARDGRVIAGAEIGERYRLMVDHLERVPLPIAFVGRLTGLLPADRIIRTIEVTGLWHLPDQAAAARRLWEAIRYEWRDRVTNIGAQVDPKGTLLDVIGTGSRLAPRIEIMVPVRSPVPIDDRAPVYLRR